MNLRSQMARWVAGNRIAGLDNAQEKEGGIPRKAGRVMWYARSGMMLLLTLLLGLLGCGSRGPDPGNTVTQMETPKSSRLVQALPDPGSAKVTFEEGRLTVASNGAQRLSVVAEVAQAMDCKLILNTMDSKKLKVFIERTTVEEALSILLAGLAYSMEYTYDPHLNVHSLTQLTVGEMQANSVGTALSAKTQPGTPEPEPPSEVRYRQAQRPPFDEITEVELQNEVEELQVLILDQMVKEDDRLFNLWSGSPQDRTQAIKAMSPTGEGLNELLNLVALDSDPEIRAAAAERLADGNGFAVTMGLIDTLGDPDSNVVLQAVDSLVTIGDRSVIASMQGALEDNVNPDVQEALQKATRLLDLSASMSSDGMAEQ